MAPPTIPYLSEQMLDTLGVDIFDVMQSLEHLIKGAAKNTVWSAPKAVITPPDGRYMMATLAAMDDPSFLATKSLVLNPRNPEHGLPQINSLVTLLNGTTGVPLAIMDGNWITALRTAGLSALAARSLARKDAASVGFIGCGVQARAHLSAFAQMFPLERIKLFGRGQLNIDLLRGVADELGLRSEVCDTAKAAIDDVDIVVTSITATDGGEPFLDAGWMQQGCFAAITDLAVPWKKDSFAGLDKLIIDDVAQEAALPNKLANPADIHGDIGDLVLGEVEGRTAAADRTAFVFRGHALGDLALASLAYQKHLA